LGPPPGRYLTRRRQHAVDIKNISSPKPLTLAPRWWHNKDGFQGSWNWHCRCFGSRGGTPSYNRSRSPSRDFDSWKPRDIFPVRSNFAGCRRCDHHAGVDPYVYSRRPNWRPKDQGFSEEECFRVAGGRMAFVKPGRVTFHQDHAPVPLAGNVQRLLEGDDLSAMFLPPVSVCSCLLLQSVILAWTQNACPSIRFGFVPRRIQVCSDCAATSRHSSGAHRPPWTCVYRWLSLWPGLAVGVHIGRGHMKTLLFRCATRLSVRRDAATKCIRSGTDSEHDGLGPEAEKH
jgi:hypothetical protein